MKTIKRTETYNAPAEKVFSCIDDLGVTGMHMTKSSAMMMGSKLHLDFLTKQHTGLGSKISMDMNDDGNENGFYGGSNEMGGGSRKGLGNSWRSKDDYLFLVQDAFAGLP